MLAYFNKKETDSQDGEPPLKKQKIESFNENRELTKEEKLKKAEINRKKAEEIRRKKRIESITNTLLESSWKELLNKEMKKDYFQKLLQFLDREYTSSTIPIYPPKHLIFNAFNSCPLDKVSVVILGQDPYHGKDQAMGMSFSVPKGKTVPPSLKNIYKEIKNDLNIKPPSHGNLQEWANQGVFLLNTVLTVQEKKPNSHKNQGWEKFTDSVISHINSNCNHVVFMLWGNNAKKKMSLLNKSKHLVLTSVHPSPFSADSGFFGCKHFSKANTWLNSKGIEEVNWKLSENIPSAKYNQIVPQNIELPIVGKKRKLLPLSPKKPTTIATISNVSNLNSNWILGNTKIDCIQGDMVLQNVDIIVNPANCHMKHVGGLARAIEQAGGDAIRIESNEWIEQNGLLQVSQVAVTSGGYLPCKILFHTVGPHWNDGKSGEEKQLESTVKNCLREADKVGVQSIALPAISTGQYKFPVDLCAKIMLNATKQYFKDAKTKLKDVRFILFDKDTLDQFISEGNKLFLN